MSRTFQPFRPFRPVRSLRLVAFVGLWVLLAACGGGNPTAEVTTADGAIDETTDSLAADELRVESGLSAGDAEDDAHDAELDDVEPIVPDAPVISSPAGRQDAQSVGGVEPEAAEAATVAASPSVADPAEAGDGSSPQVAPPKAPAPTEPVVDIPIPSTASTASTGESGTDAALAAPFVSAAGPIEDAPADSCGAACEIGGLDDDTVNPDPVVDVQAAESQSATPALPEADEAAICPEAAGADCAADAALVDVDSIDGALPGDDAALPAEPDCDARPWSFGCDGPVPAPGDFEPQEVVREEPDESTGVQVPQEIQDLLLAPIDD